MSNFECVICIVNHGFTDLVMTAAKKAGARGGTVLSARGTGNKEVEEFFGVTVTPEKDVVLILVSQDIRDNVLTLVNAEAGMSTKGMGIAFSVPVSDTVGIVGNEKENNAEEGK
ncbi:MAG: P-II family nitrogen regulator [Bacilli bacterium]|nr:P-II family nitrogen regulator [Bacilli bacterium]